jgi:hypothetical protein
MTHWDGCWDAGPRHYECAVTRIRALERERWDLRQALDDLLSACELPGEHCEIEQAIPRARAALEGKP